MFHILNQPIKNLPVCDRLKWILGDSNPGPTGYEPVALTN